MSLRNKESLNEMFQVVLKDPEQSELKNYIVGVLEFKGGKENTRDNQKIHERLNLVVEDHFERCKFQLNRNEEGNEPLTAKELERTFTEEILYTFSHETKRYLPGVRSVSCAFETSQAIEHVSDESLWENIYFFMLYWITDKPDETVYVAYNAEGVLKEMMTNPPSWV